MHSELREQVGRKAASFGLRKVAPRACIADSKQHLRVFLSDMLEELGFITSECGSADSLKGILADELPDLVLFGIAADGVDPVSVLETLVHGEFGGKVLPVGGSESIVVRAVQQVGEECGLTMLPTLTTPFGTDVLRERVAMLLPREPAPSPAVHVGEALHAGWLELWYQPKIDARTLTLCGAEALVRMRHPTWGVVPPACFIPAPNDPHFRDLSEFVIERVFEDWHYLLEQNCPLDISINLPASFLRERLAVRDLYQHVPAHPAFGGLIIEISSDEAIEEFGAVCEIARELNLHNIGLSIDNVGTNWPALMDISKFPFIRLKADAQFVTGCGEDCLKRTVCRQIVEFAKGYGISTVAVGVESRADLIAASEIGFDLMQGYFFGEPMPLKKFARSSLTRTTIEVT